MEEQKDAVKKKTEELTQVTTIAKEEEKSGKKIEMPTPEELVSKSGMSIIQNRQHLQTLLPKLGKKALQRLLMASLDLPAEGEKVKLVGKEEKIAFRLCQSTIRAMFTVMFYHTSEEIIKNHKAKQTSNQKQTEEKDEQQ